MTPISKYFSLQTKISNNNSIIDFCNKDINHLVDNILNEQLTLKKQIKKFEIELSENNKVAERIKNIFLETTDEILDIIKVIRKKGYYPDLKQGTVLEYELFSKILDSYKITLITEGGKSNTEIYMSHIKWDCRSLEVFLQNIRMELFNLNFETKLEAIKYFECIKISAYQIIDDL